MNLASIPPVAHFVWFGSAFLWVHLLAVRSAVLRGGFSRVILHHADDLRATPWWEELMGLPRFEARRLAPEALLGGCPEGEQLTALFRQLDEPAAKANMVRVALLYQEGGTFLDTDTVTVAPFNRLLEPGGVYCGQERIVWTHAESASRHWPGRTRNRLLHLLRSAFRETPGGWRGFRAIESWYPLAVNNAVLGSEPGHPMMRDLLRRMAALEPQRRRVRFALGTHLLQQAVEAYAGTDLRILPADTFYPLSPEISVHWFQERRSAPLAEVLRPDTTLVHWYSSVRTAGIAPAIDPHYVRQRCRTQLFSALALPFLER